MFTKLFESGQIGTMVVPNRIIMPPMLTCFTDKEYVSSRLINYLTERAKGGAGLIITEVASPVFTGRLQHNQLSIHDDKFLPGLQRLTDAVHAHGAKVAIQMGHGGSECRFEVIGTQPASCSTIARKGYELPRELTLDEIKKLVESFVQAAKRAKKAGFDGIEIHCAHAYLIRQFLSPLTNKRTDEYGGDLKGRARFAIEILRSIKQESGNYPVWFRINGSEFLDGGFTLDDSKVVCGWLEGVGADAVSVSAGTYANTHMSNQPMFMPRGLLIPLAAGIKSVVKVPVVAVGRIDTPEFAEQVLNEGKADFIAMGRPLIADPELPKKALEGRSNEIRRCLADNMCIDCLLTESLTCTVNAAVGKEEEYQIQPAAKRKRVLVSGGGPAGMEAARVAAMRGHEVTLCDSNGALGGQLNIANKPPFKEDIGLITDYLTDQLKRLGVKVQLNKSVTKAMVKEIAPDTVIIATGAKPLIPSIQGTTQDNVVIANDVLLGKAETGQKIIVVGGGRVGVEVAEFLGEKGKHVIIVEMLKRVGEELGVSWRAHTINRLIKLGVELSPMSTVEEIKGRNVVITRDGKKMTLEADTVVLAVGARSDKDLEIDLAGTIQTYVIGDCVKPRNIREAIADGARVAREI